MRYVGYILAALAFTVVLGLFVLALAPSALAQSSDADDALALYDENDNGIIDADEAIAAVLDYLNDRISRDLAMRVMRMYLNAHPTGQSEQSGDFPCALYDQDCDGQTAKYEVINAINDYLFGDPPPIRKDHVISIINCYLFDEDDDPDFLPVAPPVPEDLTGKVGPGVGQISLDWDSVDRANGYKVQQKYGQSWKTLTATSTPHRVAIDVSQSNAVVSGLTNGISYEHRVSAVCSHGGGSESSEWSTSITTPPPPRPTPTVSISASATSVTEGQSITFTLTASSAPTSNLPVNVGVTQTGSFIRGAATTSVTIRSRQTSASFSVDTDNDGVDEPSGSITASVETGTGYGVGSSSSVTATVLDNDLPKLASSDILGVDPLPLRRAKLKWRGVPNAGSYSVKARDPDSRLPWAAPDGTPTCAIPPAQTAEVCSLDIRLDSVVNSRGFGHADAFEFRVKATSNSGTILPAYSDTITINDNPILTGGRASGDSAGVSGQATLVWDRIPGATEYIVEYRKLGSYTMGTRHGPRKIDHTSEDWPDHSDWPYYGTSQAPLRVQQPNSGTVSTGAITGLELGELYAFQVNYRTNAGMVFSARDAYVWASGELPTRTSRVGTYPFFGYWEDGKYDYTVCLATFTPSGVDWANLIVHAFEQWEEAVPHRITVTHVTGSCLTEGTPIDSEIPVSVIRALYNESNEVYMVDTTEWQQADWEFAFIVNKFALCISRASACVISPRYGEYPHYWLFNPSVRSLDAGSVDILVNVSRASSTLEIPGPDAAPSDDDVGFNTCLPKPSGPDPDQGFSNYRIMVHEAGHALGLSNYDIAEPVATYIAHPSIPDSVMNYDSRLPRLSAKAGAEPDCSPHPFDVMAIEALYQTLSPR